MNANLCILRVLRVQAFIFELLAKIFRFCCIRFDV